MKSVPIPAHSATQLHGKMITLGNPDVLILTLSNIYFEFNFSANMETVFQMEEPLVFR